jgi:uncharacterized protein
MHRSHDPARDRFPAAAAAPRPAPALYGFGSLAATAALALVACAAPRAQPARSDLPADNVALVALAEQELAHGDAADARALLAAVSPARLDPGQRQRLRVVRAELALADSQPVVALQELPAPGELPASPLMARAEAARAQALFRLGDAVGATQALLARERVLPDPALREANRDALWANLQTIDLDTATGARLAQADAATRGWIEMAVIRRSVWLEPADLHARLAQWRAAYPDHPAAQRIDEIAMPETRAGRRPMGSVALLLPLGGPHAGIAEAVRDGFFAAYYASRSLDVPATVRVYDTGTSAMTVQAAYREALDDGAEFVVGPLTREEVAALADAGRPAVPVLALNFLDPGRAPPFNFFQSGLAPEDEARQAAERAVTSHQYRAVALVPEGEWGQRVLQAFRERLEALGGAVVAAGTYAASERDHSAPIRALLSLDASAQRHAALTNTIGVKTKFQPRRREDVHLIFIAARPDQARLIGPQLRFHRSGELPIYATSMIYDGEPPSADLDGLRFCDMPWMLAADGDLAALRSQLRTLFPSRPREYTRLLALGHDAWLLARLIDGGQLLPGSFFPAASGTLSLREDNTIARSLACAEIRNGAVRPLDALARR